MSKQRKRAKKSVKFGRLRVTDAFASRALNHYSRRLRYGEMPREVIEDMTTNERFADAVRAKVGYIAFVIGGASRSADDRELHEAMKAAAAFFELPAPAEPRWPKEPNEPKQEQPKPQSGPSESNSNSDKQESEGAEGQGKDGDGDADGEGNGEGQGQGGGEGAARSVDEVVGENPVEIDLEKQLPAMSNYVPRVTEPPPPSPIPKLPANGYASRDWRFDYGCENQLLARLRAELMAVSRHRKFRNKDTGHLDTETKLVDIATGQNLDRVFYTTTHARRLNTAVQLFIDVSGSMAAHGKIGCACALGFLLANTLEKLRVPVEIIAFDANPYLVKSWHEKVAACGVKRLQPRGSTHLPTAQTSGIKSLMMRREARKIQAIVTDGDVGWISDALVEARIKESVQYGYSEQEARSVWANYLKGNASGPAQHTALHKSCPGLETYGFGVGVKLPPGVFNRKVDDIQPKNMVETVVESLGRVLVHE